MPTDTYRPLRFFLDTEFQENGYGHPIDMISIGLIADHGNDDVSELYLENTDFEWRDAKEWHRQNLRPALTQAPNTGYAARQMATVLRGWVDGQCRRRQVKVVNDALALSDPKVIPAAQIVVPQFFGWYCAYDWTLVGTLFGKLMDVPARWPSGASGAR